MTKSFSIILFIWKHDIDTYQYRIFRAIGVNVQIGSTSHLNRSTKWVDDEVVTATRLDDVTDVFVFPRIFITSWYSQDVCPLSRNIGIFW